MDTYYYLTCKYVFCIVRRETLIFFLYDLNVYNNDILSFINLQNFATVVRTLGIYFARAKIDRAD